MSGPPIGELRRRAVLERLERTPDGGGGVTESWVEEAELWAAIRPLGGDERVVGDRIAGRLSHEITIRYRTGVTPAMRFRSGNRSFMIESVFDDGERHAWLKCLCLEDDL